MKNHRVLKQILLLLLVIGVSGCGVNNIPTYDEQAQAKWHQIENQYKRRADLIPNLINTVKGYASHEKEVLTAVVEARAKATSTALPEDLVTNSEAMQAFQDNQQALSSALSRLLVVVERYPDLKSSANFLSLQSQLEGTENRIAIARRDYIEAVRIYNTELRTYPGKLWKSYLYADAKPRASLSVDQSDLANPVVNFD